MGQGILRPGDRQDRGKYLKRNRRRGRRAYAFESANLKKSVAIGIDPFEQMIAQVPSLRWREEDVSARCGAEIRARGEEQQAH